MSTLAEIGVFIMALVGSMIATYAIGWVSRSDNDEFAIAWGTAVIALAVAVTVLLEEMGLL